MRILKFPCGAFYEVSDEETNLKDKGNRLVVHSTDRGDIKPPKYSDGKTAYCGPFGCNNRSRRAKQVYNSQDKLCWITLCTGKLISDVGKEE